MNGLRAFSIGMLLAALAATAARAQQAEPQYRMISEGDSGVIMGSVEIRGPATARTFNAIVVATEAIPDDADNYRSTIVADCPAGIIHHREVGAYQGARRLSEISGGDPRRPREGTIDQEMFNYACTGQSTYSDSPAVSGPEAALAYGRARIDSRNPSK